MSDTTEANASLLVRRSSGQWVVPSTTGYTSESELQTLLFEHPELLPGVGPDAVACREFQTGVGPADILVVLPTGELLVVECKLASNPQVRREVIGQVLDYAARLWQMPLDDFEAAWTARTGTSPFTAFGDDATAVRDNIEAALATGRFTLVLAVDGINADLRRIVEYLNTITQPETRVLAFELARAAEGDLEILLPRIWGQETAEAKTRGQKRTNSWSPPEYLDWLSENTPDLLDAAHGLLECIPAAGWQVYNGTASSPSLITGCPRGGARLWPLSLFTSDGKPTVQLRLYEIAKKIDDPSAVVEALGSIDHYPLDLSAMKSADFRRKLEYPLEVFASPSAREALAMAISEVNRALEEDAPPTR